MAIRNRPPGAIAIAFQEAIAKSDSKSLPSRPTQQIACSPVFDEHSHKKNAIRKFHQELAICLKNKSRISPKLISLAIEVARTGATIRLRNINKNLENDLLDALGRKLIYENNSEDTIKDIVIAVASVAAGSTTQEAVKFSIWILEKATNANIIPKENLVIHIPRNERERNLLCRLPIEDIGSRNHSSESERFIENKNKGKKSGETNHFFKKIVGKAKELAFNLKTSPELAAPSPEENDIRLIQLWANKALSPNTETTLESALANLSIWDATRLLSARCAELAAASFYRKLGLSVIDVSITQLEGQGDDWKTHDITVDGRPIDIKNARQSFSNRSRYSEYLVPRFKEERSARRDVSVAAVFSEYQTFEKAMAGGRQKCTILGETCQSDLDSLTSWVNSHFNGTLLSWNSSFSTGRRLPGWCFDYTKDIYKHQHIESTFEDIALYAHRNSLRLSHSGCSLMPLAFCRDKSLVMSLLDQEDHAEHHLGIWESLQSTRLTIGWSRRSLFLFVIGYTLQQAKSDAVDWSPKFLSKWLFFDSSPYSKNWPMRLYDPLGYVYGINRSMWTLWRESKDELKRFSSFRLASPWILMGTDEFGDELTIMAYCGGRLNGVKCGNSPLILGENQSCPRCKRLICDRCNHCTDHCPEMAERSQRAERPIPNNPHKPSRTRWRVFL